MGAVVFGCLVLAVSAFAGMWRPAAPIVERCRAEVGEYSASVTPTQAEHAALIAAVSVQREMPARAATIGLATAYQESDLYNIDYGDRDSVGLFQQRPSQGWGTVEQIMDPYYAANAFYDALAEISNYADLEINDAAQEVQISAHPDAYAQHESKARALASALTGESSAAFNCELDPDNANGAALDDLVTELELAFGVTDATTDDQTVRVAVDESSSRGWAIAQWSLAHAGRAGIETVAYDGLQWQLGADNGWTEDTSATATEVTITFRS